MSLYVSGRKIVIRDKNCKELKIPQPKTSSHLFPNICCELLTCELRVICHFSWAVTESQTYADKCH